MIDSDGYEPANGGKAFPHVLYKCPECGQHIIAIGWEVEKLVCVDCDESMCWHTDLWNPRDASMTNEPEG